MIRDLADVLRQNVREVGHPRLKQHVALFHLVVAVLGCDVDVCHLVVDTHPEAFEVRKLLLAVVVYFCHDNNTFKGTVYLLAPIIDIQFDGVMGGECSQIGIGL